jgi:hypothetical protein
MAGLGRIAWAPLESRRATSPQVGADCAERTQARLFFGLRRAGGYVSDAEWEAFLSEVVTPRFSDGLTVLQARGQWRAERKTVEREPSRVVEIIHHDSPDARRRIEQIVSIYRRRYRQESVMVARIRLNVCF